MALALCGLGCPADQIPLGDAVVQINLDECFGTSCEGSSIAPRTIEAPDELTCELDEALGGNIGWTVESALVVTKAEVAPDDALWVGSATQAYPGVDVNEVVIQRFDANGEESFTRDVTLGTDHDFWDASVTSIAFDANGHAFVLIQGMVADRADGWAAVSLASLLEIDPEGELVGDPIAFEGAGGIQVTNAADGGLLLSAMSLVDRRSVIGRLNPDRSVAWIQTSLRQFGLYHVAGHDEGAAIVYGSSAGEEPFQWQNSVSMYDVNGNLAWDVQPGTENGGALARGPEGHVIGLGALPDTTSLNAIYEDLFVFKLNLEGETQWSLRLVDSQVSPDTSVAVRPLVVDDEGHAYFTAQDGDDVMLTLFRVDASGEHCTKLPMTEIDAMAPGGADLIFAPSGKIYFNASGPGGHPSTFGVLER